MQSPGELELYSVYLSLR